MDFPVVKIPTQIIEAQQLLPPLPEFREQPPLKPQSPQRFQPQLILIELGILFVVCVLIFPFYLWVALGILGASLVGIGIQALWQLRGYAQRQHHYREAVQVYQERVKRYQQLLQEHEEKLSFFQSPEQVMRYQHQQLMAELRRTRGLDVPVQGDLEGVVLNLKQRLESYFPDKILDRRMGFRLAGSTNSLYIPDIVFLDKGSGLRIDIEVDEPYDQRGPRHCLGSDQDEDRDLFFEQKGWIVIRLAEQQVVCWPDSCCKLIAQVVADLYQDPTWVTPFQSIPDLRRVGRWDYQEAMMMAARKERQNYSCD